VKIVYVGKDAKRRKAAQEGTDNVLLLTYDNWDDFPLHGL